MGLEKDYPSTVSAIARTCNKLTTKGDTSTKCLFCQRYLMSCLHHGTSTQLETRPAQSGTQDWKQKISIRSYSDISLEDVPPGHVNLTNRAPNGQLPSHPNSIASSLCYACHTTWTSRSIRGSITKQTDIPLPVWLKIPSGISEEWRCVTRESMRSTIDDFLLDPDS
jgi:cytoplasmic tRNA 2-thiolation protein 2